MAEAMGNGAPLIGLPACVRALDGLDYHMAGAKYLRAVAEGAGGIPVIIPSLDPGGPGAIDRGAWLDRIDGLFITGSPSNVEPHHYGGPASAPDTSHDPARDAAVLPLIRGALDRQLPILALCRGIQELNVVLGGTLHQRIQDLPGRDDHRGPIELPVEQRYGPAHEVGLAPDGVLARLAGSSRLTVNSLHAQGIDRLAPGLAVEANAPDGTIEAVRLDEPGRFVLGIQWHPEWRFWENAFAGALFAAFGDAARARGRGVPARAACRPASRFRRQPGLPSSPAPAAAGPRAKPTF